MDKVSINTWEHGFSPIKTRGAACVYLLCYLKHTTNLITTGKPFFSECKSHFHQFHFKHVKLLCNVWEKMNIVKNRLANINALYYKFVLIFIFKSRKMDGGRGVVLRHSTQTVFCCSFCAEETHIIACQWAVDRMESTVFYKHPWNEAILHTDVKENNQHL